MRNRLGDHREIFAYYKSLPPVARLALRDQIIAQQNGRRGRKLHLRFYMWLCDRQVAAEAARDRAKAAL